MALCKVHGKVQMDSFGDRMKMYENSEAGRRFMPLLPVCARLDGKTFHTFTHGLERPFDPRLTELMRQTTKYLVETTGASIGYTQSDEISLVWYSFEFKSQIYFDGRIQKMASVLAAMTTAYFNKYLPEFLPEKSDAMPLFDCRVWQVPTLEEAANTFLWREVDAKKNSISMAARHYYSHRELHQKTGNEMQEMLFQKGVNWNDYPNHFKRGTFVQRHKLVRGFSAEELEQLPPKHQAHNKPDLVIERTEVRFLEMPPFSKVLNRVAVIFEGAAPEVQT
jgi:tRNA(His) guanylyltransferase